MEPTTQHIIDLHCDTLSECHKRNLMLKNDELHFSLDKLPKGFKLAQAMAVFMPDNFRGYEAEVYFDAVYQTYCLQMNLHRQQICKVSDTAGIELALNNSRFAAILTVEGGSVLAGKLENISRIYNLGVRMMTLTWNAQNEICGGASTELGFSDFGRLAVAEMERINMAVDVSHLSDTGFWQLCEFATKPFLASHSNSRRICDHRRNLTDEMFLEIANRGGVVGLNYYKNFIRTDGSFGSMEDLLHHVHHFLDIGGEDTIALGSDFDGADLPPYIDSLEKIEYLIESLEKSGLSAQVVEKILFKNANRFFVNLSGGQNT